VPAEPGRSSIRATLGSVPGESGRSSISPTLGSSMAWTVGDWSSWA